MVVASRIISGQTGEPLSGWSARRRDIFLVDFELPYFEVCRGVLCHVSRAAGMLHVHACVCVA